MAKQRFGAGILVGMLATGLIGIAVWLTVVYTGADGVAAAARTYATTGAHCHGAPGREPETWATNMRPN